MVKGLKGSDVVVGVLLYLSFVQGVSSKNMIVLLLAPPKNCANRAWGWQRLIFEGEAGQAQLSWNGLG